MRVEAHKAAKVALGVVACIYCLSLLSFIPRICAAFAIVLQLPARKTLDATQLNFSQILETKKFVKAQSKLLSLTSAIT